MEKQFEPQTTFDLNDCVVLRLCFQGTEASMAVKRSVRPMMKAIGEALTEAQKQYEAKTKEILGGKEIKDLSKEEQNSAISKINMAVYDINKTIFPRFDLKRESTRNFFLRFWSSYTFDPKVTEQFVIEQSDAIDEKVVEIYPDLDINLDEPEQTEEIKEEEVEIEEPKQ